MSEAQAIARRATEFAAAKYSPLHTISDFEEAMKAAVKKVRRTLKDGGTKHDAYIAAKRRARFVLEH
jgi:xanthine dehydrogenase molybdopterin-binding subunit B